MLVLLDRCSGNKQFLVFIFYTWTEFFILFWVKLFSSNIVFVSFFAAHAL